MPQLDLLLSEAGHGVLRRGMNALGSGHQRPTPTSSRLSRPQTRRGCSRAPCQFARWAASGTFGVHREGWNPRAGVSRFLPLNDWDEQRRDTVSAAFRRSHAAEGLVLDPLRNRASGNANRISALIEHRTSGVSTQDVCEESQCSLLESLGYVGVGVNLGRQATGVSNDGMIRP